MPVVISMLRGINVGGQNKIKMDALRALYQSLGLHNPQTYVQSGNVVFSTKECNLSALNRRVEDAIEKEFGFRPRVILRTSAKLKDVIARNPFATRRGLDPSKLLVTFLACDPGPEARAQVLQLKTEPDELHISGREIFTYYPNGMARPKVAWAAIERILKVSGTGRNWNSVTKLLEMAESLAL
jgi:uncharacterized protein (DUF1697 family)